MTIRDCTRHLPAVLLAVACEVLLAAPAHAQIAPLLNLPLNDGAGPVASDVSGNGNNGLLTNGPVWTSGKSGGGLSFDGTDDTLIVNNSATVNSVTTGVTVAAWVYRDTNQSGGVSVVSRQVGTGVVEHYYLGFENGSYRWFVNTTHGYSNAALGGAAPLGQWVHMVGTYDGATVNLYIDGSLQFSTSHSGTFGSDTTALTIGAGSNNAARTPVEAFRGSLDDIRLYNAALLPEEVLALYEESGGSTDTTAPSALSLLVATAASSSAIDLSWNGSIDNVGVTGYRIYRNGTPVAMTASTTYQDGGLIANTAYTYTVTALDAAANESEHSTSASATTNPSTGDSTLVNLPLDDGVGFTATDVSGNGNNGLLTNGPVWTSGKSGGGLSFDGTDDTLIVNNSATVNSVTTGVTVAAWVYRDTNQSGGVSVVSRQVGTGVVEHYYLGFENGNYRWFVNTTSGYSSTTLGGAAPLGEWVHMAGTYDGATVSFYVNGALQFSTPHSGSFASDSTAITIGAGSNDAARTPVEAFRGTLDGVRIYGLDLTEQDIVTLYQSTGSSTDPPPTVSVTSPVDGAVVAGIITAVASASDDVEVRGVQFRVDGSNSGAEHTTAGMATFSATIDTAAYPDGEHTLTAVARDSVGNRTVSPPVTLIVKNQLTALMPLGDSITYGIVSSGDPRNEDGGYRKVMLDTLRANGIIDINFVGSLSNGVSGMDRDHEGHSGFRIDEISSSVDTWMTTFQPEIVLLLIGTNDLNQSATPSAALNRLNILLDQIHNQRPAARILLANLPGVRADNLFPGITPQEVNEFNAGIPPIVSNRAAQGWNIQLIDAHSAFDRSAGSADFSSDGLHPSPLGYSKLANVWFAALYGSGTANTTPPSAPTGLTASAASASTINLAWTAFVDDVGVAANRIYRDGAAVALKAQRLPRT